MMTTDDLPVVNDQSVSSKTPVSSELSDGAALPRADHDSVKLTEVSKGEHASILIPHVDSAISTAESTPVSHSIDDNDLHIGHVLRPEDAHNAGDVVLSMDLDLINNDDEEYSTDTMSGSASPGIAVIRKESLTAIKTVEADISKKETSGNDTQGADNRTLPTVPKIAVDNENDMIPGEAVEIGRAHV